MSATAFQRMRRKLEEQTSVASRMNEDGPGDPYAKTDKNYDDAEIRDMGTIHQEGDPPPFSETPHEPERTPEGRADGPDPGTVQQEGDPPLTSVELREDEEPQEIESSVAAENLKDPVLQYQDQAEYNATDVRDFPAADASLDNVSVGESSDPVDYGGGGDGSGKTVKALKEEAKNRGVEGYSSMNKGELERALGY